MEGIYPGGMTTIAAQSSCPVKRWCVLLNKHFLLADTTSLCAHV